MKQKNLRLAAGILAGVMTVSMTACGAKNTDTAADAATTAAAAAVSTEEEAVEVATTEAAVEEEEATAVSVARDTIEAMRDVRSLNQEMNLTLEAGISAQGVNTSMKMAMEMDADVSTDPYLMRAEMNMSITALDQTQETELEMYAEKPESDFVVYMRTKEGTDDGAWTKTTQSAAGMNTDLYSRAIYEAIADNKTDAELQEETQTIDGKECYVIDVALSGELFTDAIGAAGEAIGQSDLGAAADGTSAPARLYVEKETSYPVKMEVDAKEFGGAIINAVMGNSVETEGVDISVENYTLESTFEDFNDIEAIEIPEEAKNASEATDDAAKAVTEADTEADEEDGNGDDVKAAGAAAGAAASLDEVKNAKWTDMVFALDGEVHQIPFAYSEIEDDWTIDLERFGLQDGYVLNPKDKVSGTIEFKNDDYDDKLRVTGGFMNTGDKVADILDTDIWSLTIDASRSENYPDIMLPGGITWGSTADEILAAYGDPTEEPFVADSNGYTAYNWFIDYRYKLRMEVYDDGGLKEFMLEDYGD